MKNFTELLIGDVVYHVMQNYEAEKGPQIKEIKIFALNIEKDDFQVNKHYGYNGYSYLINDKLSNLKTNVIRKSDGFLTTDKNLVNQGLKETGMKLINKCHQQIEIEQKRIEEIRKLYFEYLNHKES
jgi:hypothetical protein